MLLIISLATMMRCLVFFILFLLSQVNFSSSFPSSSLSSAPSCFALFQFSKSFSIENDSTTDQCDYYGGIASYPKTASWKEGTECCAWDGVQCDNVTGDVISIDLSCSVLSGTLNSNSTLFQLRHLKRLNLAHNDFQFSQIPSELGKLWTLTHLNLSSSWFFGRVPHEISQLSSLVSLDLSSHYPYSNWNVLDLEAPVWTGVIGNLTELRELSLTGVDMSSVSPRSLMNLSSSLDSLILYGCEMWGEIKDNIFRLPNLQILNLGINQNLKIHLPRSNWSTSLRYLDLSNATFFGELPNFIDTLKSLEFLRFSKCNLIGSIPTALGNLTQLTYLDLSTNNLTGSIPAVFENLIQMTSLDLSSNNLIGSIPAVLGNLIQMTSLDFSSNNLIGLIPAFLANLTQMTSLDLSTNSLKGSIPAALRNLTQMIYLDLSYNNFRGPPLALPPSIGILLISNNKLTGEVPLLICNASSLIVLDLSQNNLSGMIPQCLGNFSNSLSVLNLRMNKFHGSIPTTFVEGNRLRNLNLNDNQLEGSLPQSLVKCRTLEVLDVGNNMLNDTFPHWLGSLPELQVLVIRSNRFYGSIENPKTKFSFPKLRILDLSHNEFRGLLPREYFKILKAMMDVNENQVGANYMGDDYYQDSVIVTMKGLDIELIKIQTFFTTIDFSKNSFKGEIPQLIGNLKSLKGLNFSHNKLTGNIPPSLGNLSNLEWLDLSSNKFVGEIPRQLVDIPWLEVLNLSQNNLTGPIPTGKQFNTFENNSYLGNLGLCGFPLSKMCSNHVTQPQPQPPSTLHEEDDSFGNGFTWKVVLLGYGCGMVFGMFLGYLVFKTGKPKWLVRMVELEQHIVLRRLKKNARRHGGRRN